MTDTKIGPNPQIRPLEKAHAPDKAPLKTPGQGLDFDKTLDAAVNRLNAIGGQAPALEASRDAKSIKDAAAAEQARFESAMREADRLRQLHQTLMHKPAPDKE